MIFVVSVTDAKYLKRVKMSVGAGKEDNMTLLQLVFKSDSYNVCDFELILIFNSVADI